MRSLWKFLKDLMESGSRRAVQISAQTLSSSVEKPGSTTRKLTGESVRN
jgi:hypothetical protein